MKKIVVFYSRAGENYFSGQIRQLDVGNTEKVARTIADLTGADIFKLEQKIPYSEKYNTCIQEAKNDLDNNTRPELVVLPENFEQYDEIFLGYPNYCSTMPMAVYTFLESFDFKDKNIYPFCTHEGSGPSSSQKDILKTAKGANVSKVLSVLGSYAEKSEN